MAGHLDEAVGEHGQAQAGARGPEREDAPAALRRHDEHDGGGCHRQAKGGHEGRERAEPDETRERLPARDAEEEAPRRAEDCRPLAQGAAQSAHEPLAHHAERHERERRQDGMPEDE